MSEEEIDMNELINDFNEYSTEYTKTTCNYYENYLRNYQKEKLNLQQENSQLKEDIKGFEQERQTLYNTIHDLQKANKKLNRKIEKAIEYIENNSLYEEEYDYDYEENSYLSGIDDKQAKEELIEILKGDKE